MRPNLLVLLTIAAVAACGGGGAADLAAPAAGDVDFSALELAPASAVVPLGATVQLVATPKDAAGKTLTGMPAVTFSSGEPAIANVDGTGLVKGVAAGTAVISASLTASGVTRTATATVTVTAGGQVPLTVTTPGTSFDPSSLTIAIGDTVTWQFSGAVHNVTFTGAAPPGGNIPDQQVGSAVTRVFPNPGTFGYECTIHAGMVGEVFVSSAEAPVFTSLALAPTTPSISIGDTVRLIATPRDQNGSAMAGLPSPAFSTSDPATATVDAAGLVTGVGAGSATITATLTHEGITQSATATVSVTSPQSGAATVTTPSNSFSPQSVTIAVGGTVTWQFSEAVHNVTFGAATPSGGNIPDQDPGNAVSRTFTTAGTYGYECTRHSGMTGEVVVQGDAGPQSFTSLAVSPAEWAMRLGGAKQLVATPLDQNGLPMSGLPAATFTSADPAIATVDATGTLTGVALGSVTITGALTADGVTRTATTAVTVVPAAAAIVTITADTYEPDPVEIAPGGTVIWQVEGSAHNMTFDVAPPGGSIPDVQPGNAVARSFSTAGDYDYECTIHGESGRVRVR